MWGIDGSRPGGRTPSPFAKYFLERDASSARVERLARLLGRISNRRQRPQARAVARQ